MKIEFAPSYDRSTKRLDPIRKSKFKQTTTKFIDFLETKTKPEGLGLRHLRGNYWEIRVTIRDRIILLMAGNLVKFIIAGDHDEIRNFLKHL